jgi:hypothetical protein
MAMRRALPQPIYPQLTYDVYVGGEDDIYATIWKNGVATHLTDASAFGGVNEVYVVGNDVYAAGYETKNGKTSAKLWKNGTATSLTNGTNDAEARSIFVIP